MNAKSIMKRYLHPRAIQAIRDSIALIQRFLARLGLAMYSTEDDKWFEQQWRPEEVLKLYQISLPSLPPDDVQLRFTGRTGRENLQQAFTSTSTFVQPAV